MTVLRKLWWGEYSLPMAFWLFYCLGILACLVLAVTILVLSRGSNARPLALIFGLALLYPYGLTASVGVWRSAAPYWASPIWTQRFWAAAARIVVAAWIAKIVLALINGGAVMLALQMTGEIEF
jgi:hypothetical protein